MLNLTDGALALLPSDMRHQRVAFSARWAVASHRDLDAAERNISEAEARIQRQRALVGKSRAGGYAKLAHDAEDLLARMLITLEQLRTVRLLIAADLLRGDLR
jgi:hypothetical protein